MGGFDSHALPSHARSPLQKKSAGRVSDLEAKGEGDPLEQWRAALESELSGQEPATRGADPGARASLRANDGVAARCT